MSLSDRFRHMRKDCGSPNWTPRPGRSAHTRVVCSYNCTGQASTKLPEALSCHKPQARKLTFSSHLLLSVCLSVFISFVFECTQPKHSDTQKRRLVMSQRWCLASLRLFLFSDNISSGRCYSQTLRNTPSCFLS